MAKTTKEVVLLMGMPCAGKSTLTKELESQGFSRLNRDDRGGSLAQIDKALDEALQKGQKLIVLDNTYPDQQSRAGAIQIAKKHGATIRCIHLNTSIEDAQFNSCSRIMGLDKKHLSMKPHEVFSSEYISGMKNSDAVPAMALFAYRKKFEAPELSEGFNAIDVLKFKRLPSKNKGKALLLDFDDTLRKTKDGSKYPLSPDNIEVFPVGDVLKRYRDEGYLLLGISNQSGIGKGDLSEEDAIACFEYTIEQLGVEFDDFAYCPHGSFPIKCYCRKPMTGIPVYYIHKYNLNPKDCIIVGDQTSDKTTSKRSGMQFQWAKDFFGVDMLV